MAWRLLSLSFRKSGISKISILLFWKYSTSGGSVAEWFACWTQAQKGLGSNRSRDAVR